MSRDAGALWRGHRASLTTTLAVAVAGLLASCAPDDRILLEDCDVGLYWADCGGNGEPLLGCERDTGDCRWFSGGVTARGHAVSDCPTTDPCCHDFWPFTDFGPGGELLNRVRDQMAIHVLGPVTRESSIEVAFDLAGATTPGIMCGAPSSGCGVGGAGLARSGSSVVVTFGRGGQSRWELEVVTGDSWGMHLYRIAEGTRDAPPVLGCGNYSHGFRPVVEDTPPPPFWPERDEESYPRPDDPEARLRSAFAGGELLLVDVVAVEAADRGRLALAQHVETGERLRVVLPDGYECAGPGRVVAGQRYVLIAGRPEGADAYELYLGVGAEHSVMPVDERGEVDTHFGRRDAVHLVVSARGAS